MAKIFSNIKDRVLQISDYKAIKKEIFFEEMGLNYGNFKGKAKESSLSTDTLAIILSKHPDINVDWLLFEKGEMLKKSLEYQQENDLISKRQNTKTLSTPSALKVNETEIIYDDPVRNPGSVPFYESDAFGGPVPVFNDTPEVPSTYIYFPGFEDCTFALRASGDSMEDRVHAGDIIACKEIQNKNIISYGDMYLVITKEHRLIKIVRRGAEKGWIILRSYNKEYDDIDLRLDDILHLYLIKGVIKKTQI